ncbi:MULTISPECIES: metalloregulator ArsR/SmtB family transcription factor [unclassified Clostridium]|uniref:ArsR/SmtB family transcription factor n=1 Tax=unclassified Clostridium TaxID=2614128 RepID=UPI000297C513|nr:MULTISPECIES: metalloregulator ArsR/SmtB family transcription factor [unclassified Clostridium]EKQ56362.1 MAG: putative transcriptional regulator [Clostridium sp. Maddingley MBC34-26]
MNTEYEMNAKILKALSDPNRLKIIDLLSCGEKCACEILESFNFTQPTLSHHMKVLIDCGLIEMRKDSIWSQYRLNMKNANRLVLFLLNLVTEKNECICSNQNPIKCDNLKSNEEYT